MRLAPCCSSLAARAGVRQVEAAVRADRAAAAVERQALRAWRSLLALARGGDPGAKAKARGIAAALPRALASVAAYHLLRQAAWGRRTAVAAVRSSLPRAVLARALARRGARVRRVVREQQQEAAPGPFGFLDPLAAFRDGVEYTEADLAALLFPSPSAEVIDRVVYGSGWYDRLASGTRLAQPEQVASTLASGLQAGRSQQEIARDLQPLVQGVVGTAKRVARTESMRVAQAVQMDAHAQLGDLVAGWQVHATLDERTRPEHAARNGTIYWLHPKAGQKGVGEMPHPPQEADGSLAWNCRCYLTPVLREPDEHGAFDPNVFDPSKLTPDPAVYSEWWAGADERRRALAVGARRLAAVKSLVPDPGWEHFVDPASGSLLPSDVLLGEREADRAARVGANREASARSRENISRVATTGTGGG